MKNTIGNNVAVTLFGESHGNAVGCVIDGLAPGIPVDETFIKKQLSLRRPSGEISTPRAEKDEFIIESGVFEGKTTGTPLCILIPNLDTKSADYSDIKNIARPSHADYTSLCKYGGFADYRGGGHFSGRLTSALVAIGGVVLPALKNKGILVGTHIKRCAGVSDRDFFNVKKEIEFLNDTDFAVLDGKAKEEMIKNILSAKEKKDSVGGVLETAVLGMPAGVGEPFFDTVEGMLSKALFAIPAVKGVEFGAGFKIADMNGSTANDEFCMKDEKIVTKTNNSGGINGGITNGMPIIFRTAFRPTPTIGITQNTVDLKNNQNAVISSLGRHDPCIVHRARVVADSVTALVLCDLLSHRYGTDWLAK